MDPHFLKIIKNMDPHLIEYFRKIPQRFWKESIKTWCVLNTSRLIKKYEDDIENLLFQLKKLDTEILKVTDSIVDGDSIMEKIELIKKKSLSKKSIQEYVKYLQKEIENMKIGRELCSFKRKHKY